MFDHYLGGHISAVPVLKQSLLVLYTNDYGPMKTKSWLVKVSKSKVTIVHCSHRKEHVSHVESMPSLHDIAIFLNHHSTINAQDIES